MINRIEKVSLVDEAYNRIKASLMQDGLKEGDAVPSEHSLCNRLNVSRVVVREALQRLRSERLIVTYQGKGSFVANPDNFSSGKAVSQNFDYATFKETMQLRCAIEYSAIQIAVEEASDDELEKVRKIAIEMENAKNDDLSFNQLDYAFHLNIIKCSHNNKFLSVMECNEKVVMLCLESMNKVVGSREWAINLHLKLADCLVARDSKGAIKLLKNNGEYNFARMQELFAK